MRAIDLFAGIGGIRLGFEKAFKKDFETIFVCEIDKYARQTYEANFGNKFKFSEDITKTKENSIPNFDICLAGFPCQAFSVAGLRQGFNDNYKGICRGTLFLDVARICDFHKPKVIFCENVKGLVNHNKGQTFNIICETFRNLGYDIFYKILNSKDFGVPQNRERIYIVCFRKDLNIKNFEFPKPLNKTTNLQNIREFEVSSKYYLSDTYYETLKRHKARHAKKGNGFGYEIRKWNEQSGALVCGGMGRERNLVIDFRENLKPVTRIKGEINKYGIRRLTPRECARLQGFDDNFKFVLADVHLYKQFGNSVTINVITEIAKNIKKVLNGKI